MYCEISNKRELGTNVKTNQFLIYMTPVFKMPFNLVTINPLEIAGLSTMLYIFSASMGVLHIVPIILKNSSFPCIITIFLNKILLEKDFFVFLDLLTNLV